MGTIKSQTFEYLTLWIKDPDTGYILNSSVQLLYVDTVYDEGNHADPIKYLVNTEVIMRFDPYDFSYYYFRIRPNRVKFLNGTEQVFFDLCFNSFNYVYDDETYVSMLYLMLDDEYEVYTQYLYFQPDLSTDTEGGRRVLNATSTYVKDEKRVPILYEIFYIASSLGGLYTFCLFVIGLLLRPVIDKMFAHETVNTIHQVNKNVVTLLKNEERKLEEDYKNLLASKAKTLEVASSSPDYQNLNQSIQEDEPFLFNEELKESKIAQTKSGNLEVNPPSQNNGKTKSIIDK